MKRSVTDIEEIFWELYSDGYPIDHIRIPVEYGQDDNAIMEADITAPKLLQLMRMANTRNMSTPWAWL